MLLSEELVESFINGNRNYVVKEVLKMNKPLAAFYAANIQTRLLARGYISEARTFCTLLAIKANVELD